MEEKVNNDIVSKHDIVADFLKPGMVLSGDLFSKDGVFIWPAKKPITQNLINELNARKVKELYYTKQ
ncbi:MAG: hypothetical protein ACPL4C_02285, partial [Brevinematia bacterium]